MTRKDETTMKNMKFLVASDIHGSAFWCEKLMKKIEEENPDRVILLGDLLYHGPRNALPADYNPQRVADLLNSLAPRPLAVRGNCEAEVDQLLLSFPVMADYSSLAYGERLIFFTHGHLFAADSFPCAAPGDIVLSGHTHVPVFRPGKTGLYFNPGSVAIPKGESTNSYMTLENGIFRWKGIETGEYAEYQINGGEENV